MTLLLLGPDAGARIKRREDLVAHFFDRTEAVDLDVARRARIAASSPVDIIRDERFRLLVVSLDALLHRELVVVGALHERLAGEVVDAGDFRRIEIDVVAAARSGMHATP